MNKYKTLALLTAAVLLFPGVIFTLSNAEEKTYRMKESGLKTIKLPEPVYDSGTSFEEAVLKRRSVRKYVNKPLTLPEISQLLWAAQGITSLDGLRAAPSAGALYPLEVYIAAGNVTDLPDGIYKYRPLTHELKPVVEGDRRNELSNAALGQSPIKDAAAVIVFSGVHERTTAKYGERGIRYVHIETGHAAQNVLLQAASLDLGAVVIGAFYDKEVKKIIKMPPGEYALYIMPVGRR